MAKEIERKYLVKDSCYREMASGSSHIVQGYISRNPEATVRVRICDNRAFITVKGKTVGCERDEWEYEIPVGDAQAMLRLCSGTVIEKTRWLVEHDGYTWEVDEFHGSHEGLVVAEVELPSAGSAVTPPPFAGDEVTGDVRYYNSNL